MSHLYIISLHHFIQDKQNFDIFFKVTMASPGGDVVYCEEKVSKGAFTGVSKEISNGVSKFGSK